MEPQMILKRWNCTSETVYMKSDSEKVVYHEWDVCSPQRLSRGNNKLLHVVRYDQAHKTVDSEIFVHSTFDENVENP